MEIELLNQLLFNFLYAGTSSSAGHEYQNYTNPECPAETLAPGL